jgi:hypothetical protein
MADEPSPELELNRFWNELIRSAGDQEAGALDRDAAATLRRLHALARTPPPVAAQEHVDRAMQAWVVAPRNGKVPPDVARASVSQPAGPADPPARQPWATRPPVLRSPLTHFRQVVVPLATAALLLLSAWFGYLALAPDRPGASRPIVLPAPVSSPALPEPSGVTNEMLVAIFVPADLVPTGSAVIWELAHIVVAPNSEGMWTAAAGACCPGLRFDYVVDGSYAARSDGPAQVVRIGATGAEEVPPGTEVVLGPGEALISRNEFAFSSLNREATPAHLVSLFFTDGGYSAGAYPANWTQYDLDMQAPPSIPGGPKVLRLQRVFLPPGTTLAPPSRAVGELSVTLADDALVSKLRTETTLPSVRNYGTEPVTVYVLTLEPAGIEDAPFT